MLPSRLFNVGVNNDKVGDKTLARIRRFLLDPLY